MSLMCSGILDLNASRHFLETIPELTVGQLLRVRLLASLLMKTDLNPKP